MAHDLLGGDFLEAHEKTVRESLFNGSGIGELYFEEAVAIWDFDGSVDLEVRIVVDEGEVEVVEGEGAQLLFHTSAE